jgi:hypothetical protein
MRLMDVYIHSPIRLHGSVLSWLSTRTILALLHFVKFAIGGLHRETSTKTSLSAACFVLV